MDFEHVFVRTETATGSEPPVLALSAEQAKTGDGTWYVVGAPVAPSDKPSYNIVTNKSEYVRIPLYSYTTQKALPSLVGATSQVAVNAIASLSPQLAGKEIKRVVFGIGPVDAVEEEERTRFWLGIAILV